MRRKVRHGLILTASASLLISILVTLPVSGAAAVGKLTVPMTCFPAPDAPATPPCIVPADMPADTLDGTTGKLDLQVKADGTAKVTIKTSGLDPSWVITAWVSYYYPGPGVVPPDPIFGDASTEGVAGVSAPLAPTTAAYTEGLGPEPNQLAIRSDGNGKLDVTLDFNPLVANEGPLRNALVHIDQTDAPETSPAGQPPCCAGVYQPIGSSYLRAFDANGFQMLDESGRPKLVRSPVPVAFVVLVIHTDNTTHGINPGLPIFPFPGVPSVVGDHFVLGIFELPNS